MAAGSPATRQQARHALAFLRLFSNATAGSACARLPPALQTRRGSLLFGLPSFWRTSGLLRSGVDAPSPREPSSSPAFTPRSAPRRARWLGPGRRGVGLVDPADLSLCRQPAPLFPGRGRALPAPSDQGPGQGGAPAEGGLSRGLQRRHPRRRRDLRRGHAKGHRPNLAKAVAGRDPARELLLLAHQPKQIVEAAALGVGLQLSGHTHGGQIYPWHLFVKLDQPSALRSAAPSATSSSAPAGSGSAPTGSAHRRAPLRRRQPLAEAGDELFDPPLELPAAKVVALWSQRHDEDPAQRWFRDLFTSGRAVSPQIRALLRSARAAR